MTGWITDFFRFWWALFYWNTRKTWFRLHGAHRDSCPCQHFSDSGHALDSRCQAVELWHKPGRFQRICPLLTETPNGWRCGVDAERVRPFWGRAVLYAGTAVLGCYLVGTITLYAVMRGTGYQVAYRTIVWPPHWPELRAAQEKLHLARAQHAIQTGQYQAAILSLQTVCALNPRNYAAGITLANLVQIAGQPSMAEPIFTRLMHDVPEQRAATGQSWGRALLASGDYNQLEKLAILMLTEDSGRREAWLHALLFATRQTRDAEVLRPLLRNEHGLPDWCIELIGIEQLIQENHPEQAMSRLNRLHSRLETVYVPLYQVDRLLRLGHPQLAGRLLEAYGNRLPSDEAAFFRLRAFRAQGWNTLLEPEYLTLLNQPMSPRLATLFCAALIEQSVPELLPRFLDRFEQSGPTLSNETLPLHHAAYLAAVRGGDSARAKAIAERISRFTASEARSLRGLGEVLQSGGAAPILGRILPLVPLPLEIVYAIHQRQLSSATP